ncbi:efflux RND transporter periplasmic adaptor subunit [Zavarzinia compransoris]|uniref:efflux RND transporter periplasmic adaptor subunit n=1 Tax=Zavarzinia marina TaxID=2911065 RepID=UPI001F3883DE|nr:efflux RND transporter periplasmic adaptor subunit [Zavarzinia marina]MCF4164961.1 efflux RND transporter periplasmic adaptor subunit [Zavarzinia marina]
MLSRFRLKAVDPMAISSSPLAAAILAAMILGLAAPARAEGPPVEVATVSPRPLGHRVEAVGSLRSDESVVIRPEVGGRITKILFEEGRPVAAGAPLIELDASTQEAELALARAELKLAEADAERARTLFAQKTGTGRALDEAQARLASARASVDLATAQFAKTRIAAPFAGVLGLRQVSVGDVIQPGQAIVNLEAIDPLKLDFAVPDSLLSQVAPGQLVEVTVDALPERHFAGEVYAVDPLIDDGDRAIALRALVPNPDGVLRPGLFARVSLGLGTTEGAILIPEQALVARDGAFVVYRLADGKVMAVPVTLGLRRAGEVEILDGIAAGDTIVTSGQQRLRDGIAVEVVGPDGTPVSPPPRTDG